MIAKVNERKLKAIRLVTSVQNCLQNEWTLVSSNNYEYISTYSPMVRSINNSVFFS